MALTRRNTIVGLGALAAGAGVIGGTGAFTTVEAERDVSLEAASDADANLVLYVLHDDLGVNDDVISLSVDNLNYRAITTFDGALFVGNNGGEEVEISLYGEDGDENDVDLTDDAIIDFSVGDDEYDLSEEDVSDFDGSLSEDFTINPDEGLVLDLSIDLMDVEDDSDLDDALDDTVNSDVITIEAEATDN